MNLKDLETLITTIGFPIAMCWLMWKKITESDQKQSELLAELTKAINNLTIYIKEGKKNE
jgi:hypothetical protein